MALRNIVLKGDEVLRKRCREVRRFDDRLKVLADDMIETMRDGDGIGLAASQIGVLKRIFVMEIDPEEGVYVIVNPEIIEREGSQVSTEGCLSVPGYFGAVERPGKITLKYQDLEGNEQIMEADGLKATCICHETDHLNGILFTDQVKGSLYKESRNEAGELELVPVKDAVFNESTPAMPF